MDKCKKLLCFIKFSAIFLVFAITSCRLISGFDAHGFDSYYVAGSKENQEYILELFNLLRMEDPGTEGEFAVVREIAGTFDKNKDYDKLIHYLSSRTINNPSDPYNGYYFLMIARAYVLQESEPIATLYLDLILNNYPDLIVNNESIHLVCLRNLINLNKNPEKQVWYYNEMITRFPDNINLGIAYFMLGQACETVGDWHGAIQAYTSFQGFQGTEVPDFPNADQYAKQQVDFSKSSKEWTFETLPALRRAIQRALDEKNPQTLMEYQSKVNFFARSWEQIESDTTRMAITNLALFMTEYIRYSPNLESVTATEAFLRTTGWSSISMTTWYLCFRKVNFPQDPEIHGRWEWAGIYYGERF